MYMNVLDVYPSLSHTHNKCFMYIVFTQNVPYTHFITVLTSDIRCLYYLVEKFICLLNVMYYVIFDVIQKLFFNILYLFIPIYLK